MLDNYIKHRSIEEKLLKSPYIYKISTGLHGARLTARGFPVQIPAGPFLCGDCMFSPCMRGSGYYDFLPQPRNMYVRLIGDSKMTSGVSVNVDGCLSRLSLCGPVMAWRPVRGVPCHSPNDIWDRLQGPCI